MAKVSLIGKTIVANMSSVCCTNKIRSCTSLVWRDGMDLAVGLQMIERTCDRTDAALSGACACGNVWGGGLYNVTNFWVASNWRWEIVGAKASPLKNHWSLLF